MKILVTTCAGTYMIGIPAVRGQWSVDSSLRELLVYDFDLLVDHLPGKPVDRDVHPITLLALNDEVRQALRFREEMFVWEAAGLRLRAIGSTHRPLRITRHRLPARRCHALRRT